MAVPASRSVARENSGTSDVVGTVVFVGCAVWALVSAAGREGRPEGVLLAVLAVAAGYTCGRISGSLAPVATAGTLAVAAYVLAVAARHDVPGETAESAAPPGDTGAVAALLVLAVGAACCAAAAAGTTRQRNTLLVSAGVAALSGPVLGSVAGMVAAVGVLLCSLAAARMRHRLLGLAGFAGATCLMVGVSWAVAVQALPEGLAASLEGQLTAHRVLLWEDAVDLVRANPLLGAGPDRFGDLSPTALESLNSDGKPHSALFQLAAEQGVAGVLLLGAAFGWLLYALWRSPRATPVVLSAGAALTALAAVATVGNALSFTPVTAGAGLLAGLATARSPDGAIPEGEPV
ncbi:O-antigen ligase family protein [Streptomyces sp. NPDC051217]|uniref:O-antigen ligase family protein n=1 Tax=Streptomyces sp. NPDC051217 TaxID=3365644 RepID=UPI0037B938B1